MSEHLQLYATVPLGMAKLLRDELRDLGASRLRVSRAGVAFEGTLELAYRSCLWSRMASRVLIELARFPAPDADALYAGVRSLRWQDHLGPESTLAVRSTGRNAALRHTVFASRRVKDAVVDQLRDETGQRHTLSQYRGQSVVLYFYLKDDTPGCTAEACGLRDVLGDFERHNAVVLGVSPDPVDSHRRFSQRYGLTFPLLADEDHAVAEKYGVWVEKKSGYGNAYMGIARTTFIIDPEGRIARIFHDVKPHGHEREILEHLAT